MSQDRYEIQKKLGQGGAGAVYKARDTRLDRDVAVKRVTQEQGSWSQDTVDSMLKEARMLSSFTHPNIVTIYDADVDEDGPYVVMELLQDNNVDDLIAETTLTPSDFQDFATQCLEALTAAHSLNLIHRDIKPNNIVLKWLPSGKFQAKLLDFGMAKFSKEPTKQTVDHADSVLGSIYFMAPEQFERTELDARTDLYALGSVFYYTLAGVYPFTGDTPAQVMASHLTHRVEPLSTHRSDLPEWVDNWIMWMINRDMEHRPQTAQEALDLFNSNIIQQPLKSTSAVTSKVDVSAPAAEQPEPAHTAPVQEEAPAAPKLKFNVPAAKTTTEPTATQPQETTAAPTQRVEPQRTVALASPTPVAKKTVATPTQELASPAFNPTPAATTTFAEPDNNVQYLDDDEPSGEPVELPTQEALEVQKSNNGLYSLLAVVVVALLSIGILLVYRIGENKKIEALNSLLTQAAEGQKGIPTTGPDIDLLLAELYTISGQVDNDLLYRRLAAAQSSDGTDIDVLVANFATQTEVDLIPEVRQALFRVLGVRKGATSLPIMMQFIQSSDDDEVVATAIESTKYLVSIEDLGFLIDLMMTTDVASKRNAAESTATQILKEATNRSTVARELKSSLGKAKTAMARAAITRLLGALGGLEAKEIVETSLKSSSKDYILPALSALKDWPDATMTKTAINYWIASTDPTIRKHAFDTVFNIMKRYHMDDPNSNPHWETLADNVQDTREKNFLLTGLGSTQRPFALPLVKRFLDDPSSTIIRKAKAAVRHIESNANKEKK